MNLTLPLNINRTELNAGDYLELSGTMLMLRDQAQRRIIENPEPYVDLLSKIQTVYYAGPAILNNRIISCGPTTSSRMDSFIPHFLDAGVNVFIGKGSRSEEVRQQLADRNAVYLTAVGGAGAFYGSRIISYEIRDFHDLGPEALYVITIQNFPVFVVYDTKKNALY